MLRDNYASIHAPGRHARPRRVLLAVDARGRGAHGPGPGQGPHPRRGRAQGAQGEALDDALAKLQSADALDPGPALEVDLAQAQVGAGKLVEASKTLAAVTASTESTLPARKAREAAKRALVAVKARVATVKVRVKGAPSGRATVQVDDEEVDASAEISVNPGYHSVGAAAGGFTAAQREVTLAEGAHAEVTLELTAAHPVAVEEKKTTPGSRAPGAVLTVLGGAGLVAGGVFGGLAFAKTSAARSTCSGDVCPPSSADAIATSKTYGNVSTGALIGGGALALTGIILLIVPPHGSASPDDSGKGAAVAPSIGPGVAGLGATGRF